MSKLINVVNDTASEVVLECTKGHIVKLRMDSLFGTLKGEKSYPKGHRESRNLLYLDSTQLHWKIAAKKWQLKPIKDDSTKLLNAKNFAKPYRPIS